MPKPLPSSANLSQHGQLLADFEGFARSGAAAEALMQHISDRLHAQLVRYNWVGFYLIDIKNPKVLVLGPFSGAETPHTRISLSEGLCGAAATSGKTIVVNDVSTDRRYLMGSEHTKSEIIAPVFVQSPWAQSLPVQSPLVLNRVAGELDINGYFKDTFDQKEHQFVEKCSASWWVSTCS
jgi:putative methionine-R-sulfoxide reductase with GAF domain